MTDTPEFVVRCTDCPRSDEKPFLPLLIRETCPECAKSTVAKHLEAHPGHRCTVIPQPSERVPENVHRLTRRTGW